MGTNSKKFSISMPVTAYNNYQQKAQDAGLSISQFLFRAGSITSVEEAVMFPIKHKTDLEKYNTAAGAAPISEIKR